MITWLQPAFWYSWLHAEDASSFQSQFCFFWVNSGERSHVFSYGDRRLPGYQRKCLAGDRLEQWFKAILIIFSDHGLLGLKLWPINIISLYFSRFTSSFSWKNDVWTEENWKTFGVFDWTNQCWHWHVVCMIDSVSILQLLLLWPAPLCLQLNPKRTYQDKSTHGFFSEQEVSSQRHLWVIE